MRIGLIGNMNNIMFSIARHLRDRSFDAHVVVLGDDPTHFHPSNDTFELEYQSFTRTAAWGAPEWFSTVPLALIRESLEGFDRLLGCGSAPAFTHRLDRSLDVLVPYGADLIEYPLRPTRLNRRSVRSMFEFPLAQRSGVRRARAVLGDVSETIEPFLERLGYAGRRAFASPPMVHTPTFTPDNVSRYFERCHWAHAARSFREQADVLVISHARHAWESTNQYMWTKGTDVLLRGLAEASARLRPRRVRLITFEYGPDVAASRRLARELGIADQILWLPLCSRKEIMVLLSLADFACGEFGPSFFSCGTIYEALAMGRPLLHHREDERYSGTYDELYPMCHVTTASDVAGHLEAFVENPETFREIGAAGRMWHQRWGVDKPVDALVDLLES